jgi:PleD family two-component response regulator
MSGGPVRVTASFGIAAAADAYDRSTLERADGAMYDAKQQGRDRLVVSTAPNQAAARAA